MSCFMTWFLLIAGVCENSYPLIIAAGLFAIAAEIKEGMNKD